MIIKIIEEILKKKRKIFVKNNTCLTNKTIIEIINKKYNFSILSLKENIFLDKNKYYYSEYNDFLFIKENHSLFNKHRKMLIFCNNKELNTKYILSNDSFIKIFYEKIKIFKKIEEKAFIKCLNLIKTYDKILYIFLKKKVYKKKKKYIDNIVYSKLFSKVLKLVKCI
ncbi:hypothetical protein ACWNX6_00645 [Candidatus Vidania fulgoroideorum]